MMVVQNCVCKSGLEPFSSLGLRLWGRLFEKCKLNFLLHWINAVHQHSDAISQAVRLSRTLADDLARVFVERVAVIVERGQRDKPFNKQICEFDKEPELGHADNEAIEVFADAGLHELYFLPFHQLTFGLVRSSFRGA